MLLIPIWPFAPAQTARLACALMHVLFAEGYADDDYLEKYTDKPAELRQHLTTKTPAWASKITGIPEQDIIDLARLYGRYTKILPSGWLWVFQKPQWGRKFARSCVLASRDRRLEI